MAAEAIASVVLERLASVALNKLEEQFQLVMGAKDEVKKLTKSFQAIQALLYDAEIKKITNETPNAGVTLWLQRFRDVAYKMDDIIDQWITETLVSQIGTDGASSSSSNNNKRIRKNNKMGSYFSSCCSCFGKVSLCHEIGVEIKELRKELDDIISDKDKLSLNSYVPPVNEHPAGERIPTSSIIDESEIFGRDEDKKMISSMLLEDSSANTPTNPFIVSIIGMGGLGKTTLAQLVFNEDGMKRHFDMVIWVSVSDYFDQTRIAKEIIRGAGVRVPQHLSEWNDELHKLLCESVKKKKFLLALDDMWTDDDSKWEPFKLAFKNAAQGSRILVTTRKQSVADMIGSNYSHPLDVLSEKHCWELLIRLAFQGKNADKVHNEAWINIGKEIAKQCKGVPLSAKVLGNLLRVKENIIDWQTVMDNEFIWKLEKAGDGILKPALLLSYYDLPPPVRACFVYCAIFPKGHKIRKDELIGMWMAQGLIVSTGGEAVGKEYFNSLAARSFFQNFNQDLDGNIISCDMHDLVHDFAQFLTKGEYVTLPDTSSSNIQQSLNPRHLTFFCSKESFNPDSLLSSISHGEKNLRSFLLLNRSTYDASPVLQLKTMLPDLLHHLRYLRVLVIRNSDFECLPTEIEKLIHLRYLDLGRNYHLTELPDSLCNLYNLQTLDVSECSKLRKLPEELGRMINLRHLRLEDTRSLGYLPQGIGNLVSLHTLEEFHVNGSNIKLLKKLNQLEGILSISGLDLVQSSEDAYEAMLSNKRNLQSLRLDFAVIKQIDGDLELENFEISPVKTVHDVLAALQPPSLLGNLKIMNYRGSKFSNWIASDEMLPNLRRLYLDHCNCMELPAFGKLPSLEHLSIISMHELKHIGPEFYGGHCVAFPQLKTLEIKEAHGLVDFTVISSGGFDIFPLLHEVYLDDCINLKALPAFGKLPSLECLNISGLDTMKHIGTEFYGDGGGVPFPKLEKLVIRKALMLEEWDTPETLGMPCLRELELGGCTNLKALPAFGKLPSLECLEICDLDTMKHIGTEFYGDGGGYAGGLPFPKLKQLRFEGAPMLEEWDAFVTVGAGFDVMPCLGELVIDRCSLKALPALGKLGSLKVLRIKNLRNLKHIGSEFYGANRVAFPQLETLEIDRADSLEEWTFGAEDQITIMPRLREVSIGRCGALKKLPALGKLQSLETLGLLDMDSLKEIGNEFYGGGNNVSFPNLVSLRLDAKELEVWDFAEEDKAEVSMMPRVRDMYISNLKVKTLPALGKLPCLERLKLEELNNVEHIGPEFYGLRTDALTTTVFPKLHKLELVGMSYLQWWEPGSTESSMSIMPCLRHLRIYGCFYLQSLPQHLSNTLVSLSWEHSNSEIPPRLGQLEALQDLVIFRCSWEYLPREIQDMHNLRTLAITYCGDLGDKCAGDDRKIISHIPNIRIDHRTI